MPEGDTVHKLAGYLLPRLVGRCLDAGWVRTDGRVELSGRRIVEVQARGKHLLLALDDGRVLRSHLGMWGSWHHYRHGEPWRRPEREAAVVLTLDDEVYVCFKPKEVELLRGRGVRSRLLSTRLGPDLLAERIDLAIVIERAREILEPDTPVLDVLLDQRPASGIGNVYKSEVLFLERTHPLQTLDALSNGALGGLYTRARALLTANLGGGPRITRPGADGERLWVYGRKDRPCLRCGQPIRHALLGRDQRATYWCPDCQMRATGTSASAGETRGGTVDA